MGWKPPRSRPIGKPGSEAYPAQLVGLHGRQLREAWGQIRAQRALAAQIARVLGPGDAPKVQTGPKPAKRKASPEGAKPGPVRR